MSDETQKLASETAAASVGDEASPAAAQAAANETPDEAASAGGLTPTEETGDAASVDAESAAHSADAPEVVSDDPEEAGAEEAGDVAAESDAATAASELDEEEATESAPSESGAAASTPQLDLGEEDAGPIEMDWYILKVQSNRERSIADALRRKIAIEGLDEFFGDVVVPTEKVTEFKGGKKKIVERKLYPGYIVVRMHINDDSWFAVRETSGIGVF